MHTRKHTMKYLIPIITFIFFINWVKAQEANEIPVSALQGDSLVVYNLLKKSIKLTVDDSTYIHFLPIVTIAIKENYITFETYFYDKDINNRYNYASATKLGGLRFEKSHFFPEKEVYGDGTVMIQDSKVSRRVPATFKFSVNFKRSTLFLEESKTPIIKSSESYLIKADYYTKSYKNLVDYSIYHYIAKDSITDDNYYFLCTQNYAMLKQNGKFGFINSKNEVILPADKKLIRHYEQGFYVVEDSIQYFYDPVTNKKLTKEYQSIMLDKIRFYDKGGLTIVNGFHLVELDNKFNLLNYDNEELLSTNFLSIEDLKYNKNKQYLVLVKNNDGSFSLIDLFTEEIIRTEKFMQYAGRQIVIMDNDKYGIITKENTTVLETKYDEIIVVSPHIIRLPVRLKNKWALYITDESEFVTEFTYDSIMVAGQFFIVSKKGKYGVLHYDGSLWLPLEYDLITSDIHKTRYTAVKGNTEETYNGLLRKIK